MASPRTLIHLRTLALALLAVVGMALVPGLATAAEPATLRLLDTDPEYRETTITTPSGATFRGSPGLFRLRVTPDGGASAEHVGLCVDALHVLKGRTDYSVSMRTAADDPALATPRYAEAGWLLQQAQSLIAAAPAGAEALEAGALQIAVWQLTDQARESTPTADAALNARAAALRSLASGRALGGAVTITPSMPRGCAGRSSVALRLTGVPGSSATLAVTGGPGVVAPAEVRFGADGTAQAAVTSSGAGAVTVSARAQGGTLTRLARARAGQTTPQETMVLMARSFSAEATVAFEDCPVIPFETDIDAGTPATPATPVTPFETPTAKPVTPTTPPARIVPRRPAQREPTLGLTKTGPSTARAGARVRYTITVVNRGATALRGVTVADDLPTGMSLAATPAGARLRAGRVEWTLAGLAPGARRSLRLDVRIDSDASGRRCNRATASASGVARSTAGSCMRISPLRRTITPAVTA